MFFVAVSGVLLWAVVQETGQQNNHAVRLLLAAGARSGALCAVDGAWRILASAFLHGSLLHYLLNAAGLLVFGAFLEARWSRSQMVLFMFSTLLFSGFISLALETGPSVGASGLFVGEAAAVAGISLRDRLAHGRSESTLLCSLSLAVIAGVLLASCRHRVALDFHAHWSASLWGLAAAFATERTTTQERRAMTAGAAFVAAILALASLHHVAVNIAFPPGPPATVLVPTVYQARTISLPAGAGWTAGEQTADGTCSSSTSGPMEILDADRVLCLTDAFHNSFIFGSEKAIGGSPLFSEALLRESGGGAGFGDLALRFLVRGDTLGVGLAVSPPQYLAYLPWFLALDERNDGYRYLQIRRN